MKSIYYLLILTFSSASLCAYFDEQKFNQLTHEIVWDLESEKCRQLFNELKSEMTEQEFYDHPEFDLFEQEMAEGYDEEPTVEQFKQLYLDRLECFKRINLLPNHHLFKQSCYELKLAKAIISYFDQPYSSLEDLINDLIVKSSALENSNLQELFDLPNISDVELRTEIINLVENSEESKRKLLKYCQLSKMDFALIYKFDKCTLKSIGIENGLLSIGIGLEMPNRALTIYIQL